MTQVHSTPGLPVQRTDGAPTKAEIAASKPATQRAMNRPQPEPAASAAQPTPRLNDTATAAAKPTLPAAAKQPAARVVQRVVLRAAPAGPVVKPAAPLASSVSRYTQRRPKLKPNTGVKS